MLKDVEIKQIIAEISSPEEIIEIRKWLEIHPVKDQLKMLHGARIIWNNNLVIQRLIDEMEFSVT